MSMAISSGSKRWLIEKKRREVEIEHAALVSEIGEGPHDLCQHQVESSGPGRSTWV